MASRFVSGGAIDAESGESLDVGTQQQQHQGEIPKDDKTREWEIVQRELEAERKRKEESRLQAAEGGERSLYDVLQANKGLFPSSPNAVSHLCYWYLVFHCTLGKLDGLQAWRGLAYWW